MTETTKKSFMYKPLVDNTSLCELNMHDYPLFINIK